MIPCKNCLVLPICRQKELFTMLDSCEIIRNVLYTPVENRSREYMRKDGFYNYIIKLENIMKPLTWKYIKKTDNFRIARRTRIHKYTYTRAPK